MLGLRRAAVRHVLDRFHRRGLAAETKTAFKEPPAPPADKKGAATKVAVIGGLSAILVGVTLWPENNYGIDAPPPPPADQADQTAK